MIEYKEMCQRCMGQGWVARGKHTGERNWEPMECRACNGTGEVTA